MIKLGMLVCYTKLWTYIAGKKASAGYLRLYLMLQIADFGLSRDLQSEDFYLSHGGKIPVKWTAPEALQYRLYSPASDAWSYGIVLYEIWSLGCKPYHEVTNEQVPRSQPCTYRSTADTSRPRITIATTPTTPTPNSSDCYGGCGCNWEVVQYSLESRPSLKSLLLLRFFTLIFFDFLQVPSLLSSGYRLPPPPGCPRTLYDITMRCWWVHHYLCPPSHSTTFI